MGYRGLTMLGQRNIFVFRNQQGAFHSIPNKFVYLHIKVDTQPHLKTTFFRSLMDSTKNVPELIMGTLRGQKKSARDLGTVQWLPADLSLLPIIQQELA